MLSSNSVTFQKKREGILGQFTKTLNKLKDLNLSIQGAKDKSVQTKELLVQQAVEEDNNIAEYNKQIETNQKTIEKIQDFLV